MKKTAKGKIRYAVVGLGHIAQTAVLPAFAHARKNSELAALVSGTPRKLKALGKKYGVKRLYSYEDFETCLETGEVDAVYIATPNTEHQYFAEKAAEHGVHVLCEKPLATDESTCISIIEAAQANRVKLMTAYRLHFDEANLKAVEAARSGKLGDLRVFNSIFTMQIDDKENIRLKADLGGGPLFDIGIYCVNAARYLFRAEPIDVFAMSAQGHDARFKEVPEMLSAILRFPGDRLASFTVSFGAADSACYDLIGTKNRLRLENAYEYAGQMHLKLGKEPSEEKHSKFGKHDQFAAELVYFSDCVLKNRQPEPSGSEGLADIRVIQALLESARRETTVSLAPMSKRTRPSASQKIVRPPVPKPPMPVQASAPHGS